MYEEQLINLIYDIKRENLERIKELESEVAVLNSRLDAVNYLLNNCVYRLDNLVIKED